MSLNVVATSNFTSGCDKDDPISERTNTGKLAFWRLRGGFGDEAVPNRTLTLLRRSAISPVPSAVRLEKEVDGGPKRGQTPDFFLSFVDSLDKESDPFSDLRGFPHARDGRSQPGRADAALGQGPDAGRVIVGRLAGAS